MLCALNVEHFCPEVVCQLKKLSLTIATTTSNHSSSSKQMERGGWSYCVGSARCFHSVVMYDSVCVCVCVWLCLLLCELGFCILLWSMCGDSLLLWTSVELLTAAGRCASPRGRRPRQSPAHSLWKSRLMEGDAEI